MRVLTRHIALAALLASACVVKDFELVDALPGMPGDGGDGGRSGSSNTGATSNEGGDDDPGSSGGDTGGSDSGGSAGTNSGASGGSGGTMAGGSGGAGGGGGGAGNEVAPETIPDGLLLCDDPNHFSCDDFEGALSPHWPIGTEGVDEATAPSGDKVYETPYEAVTMLADLEAVSISFWVRLESIADQRLVSFVDTELMLPFGFGVEHSKPKWIFSAENLSDISVVAPSESSSGELTEHTWFCVQVRADLAANTYDGVVVVPGAKPIVVPTLDREPTGGVDDEWYDFHNGWGALSDPTPISFGQKGAYLQLDDVLVAEYDVQTLCEAFLMSDD